MWLLIWQEVIIKLPWPFSSSLLYNMTQCCVILCYLCVYPKELSFSLICLLRLISSLVFFSCAGCNDLVASGRDRKPNALVQVAVIDPHKQHLLSLACTEIVEVRHLSLSHTQPPSDSSRPLMLVVFLCLWVTGSWLVFCPSLPALLFLNLFPPVWFTQLEQTMSVNLLFPVTVETWHPHGSVCSSQYIRVQYVLVGLIVYWVGVTYCERLFVLFDLFKISLYYLLCGSAVAKATVTQVFFGQQQLPPVPPWNTHLHACA